MIKKLTFIVASLLLCAQALYAQDSLRTDTLKADMSNIRRVQLPRHESPGMAAAGDTLLFEVQPWQFHKNIGWQRQSSDSLLRWQLWSNWADRMNRRPGVISYRLGTLGRTDGLQVGVFSPRQQQLNWEDVPMNDPVSGSINWNFIPHHKIESIYSDRTGLQYRTDYYLRQYYLNKPESQLNYDESKANYRNLEFMVTQNFSQKTNAEISYWYRRDGDYYPRSVVSGQQIFGKVFHQLNHKYALKVSYLHNGFDNQEPFGYVASNLFTFNFNRFGMQPVEGNAQSETRSNNLVVSLYRRPRDRPEGRLQARLLWNSHSRRLSFSRDTTDYQVRTLGAQMHKWLALGPFEAEGFGATYYRQAADNPRGNLAKSSWMLSVGRGHLRFEPFRRLKMDFEAETRYRSDARTGYTMGGALRLEALPGLWLHGNIALGKRIPQVQELYWKSLAWYGTESLSGPKMKKAGAGLTLRPWNTMEVGVRGEALEVDDGIQLGDSSFVNVAPYRSLSATAFAGLNSSHWELGASATVQQFENRGVSTDPLVNRMTAGNPRLWIKGSAYWKGYAFSRAAFLKIGLNGVMTPFNYYAPKYRPALDYWDMAADTPVIPSYYRVDLDISARVRTIMVVLRYENVLDQVGQPGYFETAAYPMPPRRFMFGIRALFRN